MQTFLPFKSFSESAKVLDMKRLGKQRVEAMQIMQILCNTTQKAGWRNHPAVKMWRNHEYALLQYVKAVCDEWTSRGYKDTCYEKTYDAYFTKLLSSNDREKTTMPAWLGNEAFHASHRSNLLRKNKEWYSQFNWTEDDTLEYVWPTTHDEISKRAILKK